MKVIKVYKIYFKKIKRQLIWTGEKLLAVLRLRNLISEYNIFKEIW